MVSHTHPTPRGRARATCLSTTGRSKPYPLEATSPRRHTQLRSLARTNETKTKKFPGPGIESHWNTSIHHPYIRYICIYIYRRLGGWVLLWNRQPGNRFVSFVRASGRGEAKLCGRARGDSIVKLGLLWGHFRSCYGQSVPGLSATNAVFTQVLQGCPRTTLAKPM